MKLQNNFRYIVQINRGRINDKKKLKPMYVVVDSWDGFMRLVNNRQNATRVETRGMAEMMSTHFWEHWWKDHKHSHLELDSREVVQIKVRAT